LLSTFPELEDDIVCPNCNKDPEQLKEDEFGSAHEKNQKAGSCLFLERRRVGGLNVVDGIQNFGLSLGFTMP